MYLPIFLINYSVVVTDMGAIMVKSHSKVLLVLHLEDVFISNVKLLEVLAFRIIPKY